MLGGNEGIVGVDGSSEVDGDDVEGWGRSSARTTSAGVPRETRRLGRYLNRSSFRYLAQEGVVMWLRSLDLSDLEL